ncbi:threonine dehydratase [Candidatus Moduliflexus flocculans]|uniref:Threonine dehydratase n=1 Tax=Candidatus Moduliflexus flocculans TaxID=1499966 RepID=A0A0S6W3K5_9BACT|nr:threonine dehydratase [Candidatus Moduliflexus flocculans]
MKNYPISLLETIRARSIVSQYLKPTQLIRYEALSRILNANVFIKHENHHPTGSFKIRGGVNLMAHLKRQGISGVITFSTGNHGLSIATAAKWAGLSAVVVVPERNNPAKNRKIRETGAELIEAGKSFEEASQTVERLCAERGLYYAHPADEPHLINGVGTEFLEILEDAPDIDVMIVPLGGGSEAAAAITVLKTIRPHIDIIAVQAQNSSAAYRSWKAHAISSAENTTFAGGFATGKAYETTFNIYKDGLRDFVLLSEEEIYQSIGLAHYYTQQLVEGAGSSTLMAAFKLQEFLKGKTIVLQMSGCNASIEEIERAMTYSTFREGWRSVECRL